MLRLVVLSLVSLSLACGQPARPALLVPVGLEPPEETRVDVLEAAQRLNAPPLQVRGIEFDPDPVGYLRAAYWAAGIDLFEHQPATDPSLDGLTLLAESARLRGQLHHATPRPGDIAFFSDDGGRLFMAALVTKVEPDTLVVRGWFARGPADARVSRTGETGKRVEGDEVRGVGPLSTARAAFANPFGP